MSAKHTPGPWHIVQGGMHVVTAKMHIISAGDEQGRIVWTARLEHCRAAITKAQGETA